MNPPDSDFQLKPMPVIAAVQVLRYQPNPETGVLEPWPVATCEIDAAGRIAFRGDAGKAFEPLLRATKKSATLLASLGVAQALQEAQELKEESKL